MRTMHLAAMAAAIACGVAAADQDRTQANQAGPQPRATLAIVGGFLIDGFGGPPRPDSVILVDGETIVAVGDEGRLAVPSGARVVDANGYTVMPGLIDSHVHLTATGRSLANQDVRSSRSKDDLLATMLDIGGQFNPPTSIVARRRRSLQRWTCREKIAVVDVRLGVSQNPIFIGSRVSSTTLTPGATFSGGQFFANSDQYRSQSLLERVVLSCSIASAFCKVHQAPAIFSRCFFKTIK